MTTFSYDVEPRRGVEVFDRTIAPVSITATVLFDNLTRRHQLSRSVDGRLEAARPGEDRITGSGARAYAATRRLVCLAVGRRGPRPGEVHVHSVTTMTAGRVVCQRR